MASGKKKQEKKAACGGCKKRKTKCKKGCVLRQSVEALWPNNVNDQGDATEVLTSTFTPARVLQWLNDRPVKERPEFFLKLLLTAHNLFDDKRSKVQALLLKATKENASNFCKSDCPRLFTDLAKAGSLCEACVLGSLLVEAVMLIPKRAKSDPGPESHLNFFVKLLLTVHSILNVKKNTIRDFLVRVAKDASSSCESGCPDFATAKAKEATLCAACQLADEVYNAFSKKSGQGG